MLQIKGKYNQALVMIDTVDETTMSQIYQFLNHPAFANSHIAVMPDCHAGKGAVVGFTMTMNEYVIPNVVGVDIGCGVTAYNIGKVDVDFDKFDKFIRENIPYGFNRHSEIHEDTTDYYNHGYICDKFIFENLCNKIGVSTTEVLRQIGTLGGGNHFIELCRGQQGHLWVCIHSGSRNFGLTVATYHQKKAKELMKKMFIGDAYRDLEFLPLDNGGQEYLDDMFVAQQFAHYNRLIMARDICHKFFNVLIGGHPIESVHNYISTNEHIIRKGAISAHDKEVLIIPLNMRDGSIIAEGKGNKSWNYSAPHGAGRILSRSKAKEQLSLDEFKTEMQGIWSSCIKQETLDESPMAYKNAKDIIAVIGETVDIVETIKPIYNFKAS